MPSRIWVFLQIAPQNTVKSGSFIILKPSKVQFVPNNYHNARSLKMGWKYPSPNIDVVWRSFEDPSERFSFFVSSHGGLGRVMVDFPLDHWFTNALKRSNDLDDDWGYLRYIPLGCFIFWMRTFTSPSMISMISMIVRYISHEMILSFHDLARIFQIIQSSSGCSMK